MRPKVQSLSVVLIRLLLVKILMLDYNTNFDTVVDVNTIVTCSYDEMSDLMYIVQLSCTETRFQKCSQYGKMVLNTQCYQYLLLRM